MENQQDNFKWFGEGFDGFPKILPDDCVQYVLYVTDAKLSDFDIRKQLRTIQIAANALCKSLLKDFIWQRDAFCLELIQGQGRSKPILNPSCSLMSEGHSFLQGRTNFGDSIEDEWLVVYLLRELSRKFPQSWIRVFDSDGEFLLIEAADQLPKWLNPDVAENRIWINGGRLLIIPKLPTNKSFNTTGLKIDDALTFIQTREPDLLHTSSIESEAFHRLQKYPTQIKESLHYAMITIPRKLACVLHDNASRISPAVEAFYLRDPIALRPLQLHRPSRLFFPPEDFVTVSVKFAKVGYAQIKGQDFPTPPAWVAYTAKDPKARGRSGWDVGMKITCGFEMLLSDPQNVDKKPVREIKLLLEDLDAGEEQLPSDNDISQWDHTVDDESWLDIDFNDFDRELSGKTDAGPAGQGGGFGDRAAQANLRRMVTRFEKFLNDDDGTAEDADFFDDTDDENTSNTSDETASRGGVMDEAEEEIDFDEDRFTSMMRDMMGLPPVAALDNAADLGAKPGLGAAAQMQKDSVEEKQEIREVMDDMEEELRQAGALSLEPLPEEIIADPERLSLPSAQNSGATTVSDMPRFSEASTNEESAVDDEVLNIDFDRVKDLLKGYGDSWKV
ncbi:MAG: hypothetical protein Q9170_004633 [Blastenia crenularia]